MFEALEILACLMFPEQKNLNGWLVRDKFKPIALTLYTKFAGVPRGTKITLKIDFHALW